MSEGSEPFLFMDLSRELRIAILEQNSLVTPARRVYWGAEGFYLDLYSMYKKRYQWITQHRPCRCRAGASWGTCPGSSFRNRCCGQRHGTNKQGIRLCYCWSAPTSLFMVSRDFYQMAMEVFTKWNTFGVMEMETPPSLWEPIRPVCPIPFFQQIIPTANFRYLTSLYIEVKMYNFQWRAVAEAVAPSLTRLKSLTLVGKYDMNNYGYDFGSTSTVNQLRTLIESRLWPIHRTLGSPIEQFIVHFHGGGGHTSIGRWPDLEPVYFLEAKDDAKPTNATIHGSIKEEDDGMSRRIIVGGRVWIEGIVSIVSLASQHDPSCYTDPDPLHRIISRW
ncbi:hypothetical protein PG993_013709 [Apiospora rasikravindrae]|uniref:Uncharacterized protein n=1 Tax=Apiospora rasikravindrae TaxID=990691 RepID=A0ABR1RQY3_9PEZI